jgi:16S rRNA (uracil1498-N3)-methyltransferase
MFRYFCLDENIKNNNVVITGSDARHLKTILRAHVGDVISIVTTSNEFTAEIKQMCSDDIICELKNEVMRNNETNINITLCQGIPKQTKMETIIQQNVEIGVKTFVPLVTERTVVKLNEKDRELKKLERWQKNRKRVSKAK